MDLNERLQHVAVVGAAGKMGSGIALLLSKELAYRALEQPDKNFIIDLIDINDRALMGLLDYLREQAIKEGEKGINRLRKLYKDRADLIENGEMITAYADEVMRHVRTGKALALAAEAHLVFEAAFEKEELKVKLYKELAALCAPDTFILTNTSSIPLGRLATEAGIEGRLIGYHFYNPPAVQKLLEIITPVGCNPDLQAQGVELAKVLGKKVVPAHDIAGFIGNGHFMRDGLHALREVERLAPEQGFVKAMALLDTVSRDWLMRPMGIFQLIDYVGVDVFQLILQVMDRYLGQGLHSPLIDRFMELGIKGGQTSSGSQKDGLLKYEKGKPVAIFDLDTKAYVAIDPAWAADLGPLPNPAVNWKSLSRDADQATKLRAHFDAVKADEGLGATLAKAYAAASKATGLKLVEDGVAHRPEDVNQVLCLGFFHLYGPINDYL